MRETVKERGRSRSLTETLPEVVVASHGSRGGRVSLEKGRESYDK